MEETGKLKGPVALLGLALGNIAQALASVGEINARLVGFFGVRWIGYLFFSVFVVLFMGYFFGFSALRQKITTAAQGYRKVVWALLILVLATGATLANVRYMPKPKAETILKGRINTWLTLIFTTQDQRSNGGFRTSVLEPTSDPQVFTTAQSLTAALSVSGLSRQYVKPIRAAFAFIEEARDKSGEPGWGYWRDITPAVTEIAAWVTIARVRSLRSETIWSQEEKPEVANIVLRDLEHIAQRQDSTGGWSPTREVSDLTTRTYSTTMALWALIEAYETPLLREKLQNRYDDNIKNGFFWLMNQYEKGLYPKALELKMAGWLPNPHRPSQKNIFPGLTAQVLFVLSQGEKQFKYFAEHPTYKQAKRDFLENEKVSTQSICANSVDADQYVGRSNTKIEGMTFLWFPWSLLTYKNLSEDESITPAGRKAASKNLSRILGDYEELFEHVESGGTYQLAENLFCVSTALERQTQKSSRD